MNALTSLAVRTSLQQFANKQKAMMLARFFKTGKGQYGEGDVFLGIVVPDIRRVASMYQNISPGELTKLLHDKHHEVRMCALLIAVRQFQYGGEGVRKRLFHWYLNHTRYINNWDLVDLTAEHIIGSYLDGKNTGILRSLAQSNLIWDRRIAILATFHTIKQKQPEVTFEIAKILLHDPHDLIQKAVGWMLREIGKRCGEKVEEQFLKKYAKQMPGTMLRYAIERFGRKKRKQYLSR